MTYINVLGPDPENKDNELSRMSSVLKSLLIGMFAGSDLLFPICTTKIILSPMGVSVCIYIKCYVFSENMELYL